MAVLCFDQKAWAFANADADELDPPDPLPEFEEEVFAPPGGTLRPSIVAVVR